MRDRLGHRLRVGVLTGLMLVVCGGAAGEDGPVWRSVEGLPQGVLVVVSVRSPEALKVRVAEALEAWGLPIGSGWVMGRLGMRELADGQVVAGKGWQIGGMRPGPPRALREVMAEQDVVAVVDQRGLGAMQRSLAAVGAGLVVQQQMMGRGIDVGVATSAGNGVSQWVKRAMDTAEVVAIGLRRVDGGTRLTVAAQVPAAKGWRAGVGLSDGANGYAMLLERAYLVRGRVAWPGLPEAVRSVTAAWYVPTLEGMRASGPIEAAAWVEGWPGVRGETLRRRWLVWLNGLERQVLAWPPTAVPGRESVAWHLRRTRVVGVDEVVKGAAAWRVEARFGEKAYERYDPAVMLMDGASLSGAVGVMEAGMWMTVGEESGLVKEAARAAAEAPAGFSGLEIGSKQLLDGQVSVLGVVEAVNLYSPLLPGRLRLREVDAGVRPVSFAVEVMRVAGQEGVVVATVELPDDAGRAMVGVMAEVFRRVAAEPARP
ncbi:MAG: hypothetical protein AAF797_07970 [Planctomycetota bacterium]